MVVNKLGRCWKEELAPPGAAFAECIARLLDRARATAPLCALVLKVRIVGQKTPGWQIRKRFLLMKVSIVVRLVKLGILRCDLLLAGAFEEQRGEPDGRDGWQIEIKEDEGESERCNPGAWRDRDAEQSDVVVDRDKGGHGRQPTQCQGCPPRPASNSRRPRGEESQQTWLGINVLTGLSFNNSIHEARGLK
jgi:hypothetical protein